MVPGSYYCMRCGKETFHDVLDFGFAHAFGYEFDRRFVCTECENEPASCFKCGYPAYVHIINEDSDYYLCRDCS